MNAPALLLRWISSFPRDRTVKVRILGHTSKEIAINYGVPQGSPISPLLFLLYMFKLPKLLPNTRRSLFADDFMIYSESSITRSDLIQSNLQISMDALTIFNSDHRIILSCTNSIFSSTYCPSTSTLIRPYKSYIRSLFDYGAPATCVASPAIQLS